MLIFINETFIRKHLNFAPKIPYLMNLIAAIKIKVNPHCIKRVRIRSYSGPHFPIFGLNTPYSDPMRENADQNNSEYGHILRSALWPNV